MEFILLVIERYLRAPRLSVTVEMYDRAINKIIRALMLFIISVCLLIEKAMELDKVTLSMPYIQLQISRDKRIKAIIILGYVASRI